jgi:hypothetical protein
MSPLYSGPMHAYRCGSCGGVIWFRPGVEPPGLRCGMMGCSGRFRRAPDADLRGETAPAPSEGGAPEREAKAGESEGGGSADPGG